MAPPSTALASSNAEQSALATGSPGTTDATPTLDRAANPALHEVRQTVEETISGAPAPYGAWNGAFGWESRLNTSADEATRAAREAAIESKWGGRYTLVVAPALDGAPPERFRILCDLQWVSAGQDAHYTITPNASTADESGRAGLGGTTSMTGWGVGDTVDVAHEYGHMLGAVEDYFTTNGTDNTQGGKRGFRDAGGGIMNNPADDPFTQHYELVRVHAARSLGVEASRCSVA